MMEVHASLNGHNITCFGDTGAWNFIDYQFCKDHSLPLRKLLNGFTVGLADGSKGQNIDFACHVTLDFGKHTTTDWFLVTKLASHPVTLGLPWFRKYVPEVQKAFDNFTKPTALSHSVDLGGGVKPQIPPEFSSFSDVFDPDFKTTPPQPTHGHTFRIHTKDDQLPPPSTAYPVGHKDKEIEQQRIQELLSLGRIEPSSSCTAAASFFVNKACDSCHQLRCSCGQRLHERRWVIDYRPLNELTPQDAYPLPHIKDLLLEAPGQGWYIKFDVDSAFFLIPVEKSHRFKTAFVCSSGLYQWTVMPMGAKNAPATFQRLIDSVLAPARAYCRAYLDDGICWASTREELITRFTHVLTLLRAAGLRLKLKKCEFFRQSVTYLGYIISSSGISTDPEKVRALLDWPEPRTKTDIRGFLGLCNFYKTFFPAYSHIAAPLIDCTKNTSPNEFDSLPPAALQSFHTLRAYWSNPANLGALDPTQPVDIYTDCSSEAWFGSIEQNGKPLCFGSGKLTPAERKWPTTDRELFACLMMHRKFGYMLQGKVTWYTDHHSLLSLKHCLANSPRRTHWSEELSGYPFVICHKPGKDLHVDGLTRHSTFPKDAGFTGKQPILDNNRFITPLSPLASSFLNTLDPDTVLDLGLYIAD